MGNEFFNRNKGAIRKCRDKETEKIAAELIPIVDEFQIISFTPLIQKEFCENQKFEIRLEGNRVILYHERNLVGISENISPTLVDSIQKAGGTTLGAFDRFRPHSRQLDVSVALKK
jgi:hypothetical protein